LRIVDGHTEDRLPAVRELFAEYAASLEVDLSFQDFDSGRELPGDTPARRAAASRRGRRRAASRPSLRAGVCERKRLYVRLAFQGTVCRCWRMIVEAGGEAGYESMRLTRSQRWRPRGSTDPV
jgi:hypothetical protein